MGNRLILIMNVYTLKHIFSLKSTQDTTKQTFLLFKPNPFVQFIAFLQSRYLQICVEINFKQIETLSSHQLKPCSVPNTNKQTNAKLFSFALHILRPIVPNRKKFMADKFVERFLFVVFFFIFFYKAWKKCILITRPKKAATCYPFCFPFCHNGGHFMNTAMPDAAKLGNKTGNFCTHTYIDAIITASISTHTCAQKIFVHF